MKMMRKKCIAGLLVASLVMVVACGADSPQSVQLDRPIDLSTPDSVLTDLVIVVKAGQFELLRPICDPLGRGDGDTKRICNAAEESQAFRAELMSFVESLEFNALLLMQTSETVDVPISYMYQKRDGSTSRKEDSIKFIEVDGLYYLYSM